MNNTAEIDAIRDRIKERKKSFLIDTGRDLIKAKALLKHGAFGDWLKTNFDWSESTANNYMNAAKLADQSPEFGVLAPSALTALAAPNTPESVKAEVAADIAKGKIPTHKEVNAKINATKPKQSQSRKIDTSSEKIINLPTRPALNGNDEPTEQDLIASLQAAGFEVARTAFQKAFPSATVLDDHDALDAA